MSKIYCIFCNENNVKSNSYIFNLKYKNKYFCYYKCKKCKIYFVNPLPSDEDLENIYNKDYFSSFYMKDLEEDINFKRFFNKIKKFIKKNDKILDYGCGDGKFLRILKNKNFDLYGSDLPGTMLNNLIKNNLNIISMDTLSQNQSFFNLIYLRDVFEHSRKPKQLIDDLNQLLVNKGYLVIDGPVEKNFSLINYSVIINYKLKKFFKKNVYENPPYHLSIYSKNQLINFINNNNFNVKDFELYEAGWPLEGKGFMKDLIVKISIIISKLFFLKKIYGNRLLLVLEKK